MLTEASPVVLLSERLNRKTARLAIVGMGYVGLPLALEYCRQGFHVDGLEDMRERRALLRQGHDYISGDSHLLGRFVSEGRFTAADGDACLQEADVIVICVPTPLNAHREPDVSMLVSAARRVGRHLRRAQLVVLESTTYPGTTEEILVPALTASGLQVGRDFFVAYSPERVDIGNTEHNLRNTPKVVGGMTPACSALACQLYRHIVDTVVEASSPRAAEMEKLLENIYRCVNIALINELAMLAKRMNIDIWEVIRLAATKPYGFTPFYPGPGLGGHCIPVDPFYLTWKARAYDFNTRFIELAGEINCLMPRYVVDLVVDALGHHHKSLHGSRVLVVGLAYKRNVADWRESPALKIIDLLRSKCAVVDYHDDLIPEFGHDLSPSTSMQSVPLEALDRYDVVVITTDHSYLPLERIARESRLIVDTRHALAGVRQSNIWTL